MLVRFGYVSTAISLYDASPSKTMTFKRYSQLSQSERTAKLESITATNIANTFRTIYYNAANQIELYRMSSSLVPLATHPEAKWDYLSPFRDQWQALGNFIKEQNMRVSFHPNQFTLFTSPKQIITTNAVGDMSYHYSLLEAMGIEKNSYINIHIGGAYGDKPSSITRFHKNLKQLPSHIKAKMTLENDDKTYTATETLEVCEREKIPFVFDYHHHMANPSPEPMGTILPRIFQTWEHTGLPPKIHISSPKTDQAFRSHADDVELAFIEPFLKELKKLDVDVDFMIEAKKKDQAMLKLVNEITQIRGVKRLTGATVKI